jgi:hypothetical protein
VEVKTPTSAVFIFKGIVWKLNYPQAINKNRRLVVVLKSFLF